MPQDWQWEPPDDEAARELAGFVPEDVFDAHAHLHRLADFDAAEGSFMGRGPDVLGAAEWRAALERLFPAARVGGGMFCGSPMRGCRTGDANRFVAGELAKEPGSRGLALVAPHTPRAEVEAFLDANPAFVGLKPYHLLIGGERTFEASLEDFAPEWMWRLAHERGLVLLIHLVRKGALSDLGNLGSLRRLCRACPNVRVVLAHAARGFHAPNTVKAVRGLDGLDNVWFDMAGVCEAAPMLAILDAFGPTRLMFGTDFPVSEQRARCVTVGDQFHWLRAERVDSGPNSPPVRALPTGVESLRALREAADAFGLDEGDLADVFARNVKRLAGVEPQVSGEGKVLADKAKRLIPGGAQLLSKRPEMFAPGQWPAHFREARGIVVRDMDGRRFEDFSITGIGATVLGYRDPDVTRAVLRRVRLGSYCILNPPEEVELAERLLALHPWAQAARFMRCGGEAMAAAVRIARAATDRSEIAFCGYHGWHDWYLAANLGEDDALRGHLLPGLAPLGVPRELRGTAHPFAHGDRDAFQKILDERGDRLAAVVMEPCRHADPPEGFLEFVREGARKVGALLVFDEITIGWRLVLGGAHLRFGVAPDLAVFAKSLGAGHPMAAVVGTDEAMEGAHVSFVSSTYWTEGVGPAAALAAVKKMERVDVPGHVAGIGGMMQEHWREGIARHGLPAKVADSYPCLARFAFGGEHGETLRTLFTQEMLGRGFLAGCAFYPTLAHTEEAVARYAEAADAAFAQVARAAESGEPGRFLKGPVAHSGFRRLV